ncbi:MAG TPA: hypothetical protein VFH96_06435 [Pyrinomonadaceae bacterium]|nr:hypothetical protein [Pyrinomonadaceae bacterium]
MPVKLKYSLLLLLVIGLATSSALVRSYAGRNPTKLETSSVAKASIVSADDVPQVISLQVTPSGFEPRETIAPKGKFLILLQNRTGRRDLNFWLARENEGRVAESKSQNRDWKAQVQLAPGAYIIGETNHPEWQSIIRVTN